MARTRTKCLRSQHAPFLARLLSNLATKVFEKENRVQNAGANGWLHMMLCGDVVLDAPDVMVIVKGASLVILFS